MSVNGYMDRYSDTLVRLHTWRNELDIVYKVLLALGFAALTGLMAQVKLALPFTPIPITGQTFAVLMAGILLGRWGAVSMTMYVGLGIAGIPWFTNAQGGLATLTGATVGYLVGFVLAAAFLGYMTERYVGTRKFAALLPMMLFANFALIYIPGLVVLYFWWGEFIGPIGFAHLLAVGFLPFFIGDLIKIAAAASVSKLFLPARPGQLKYSA